MHQAPISLAFVKPGHMDLHHQALDIQRLPVSVTPPISVLPRKLFTATARSYRMHTQGFADILLSKEIERYCLVY